MSPVRSRKCLRQQSLTNVRICSLQILLRQSEKRLCLRGSIRDTVDSRQRRKIIKAGCNLLAQPVVVSPPATNGVQVTVGIVGMLDERFNQTLIPGKV